MKVTKETRALAHEILAYWLRFNHHRQDSWVGNADNIGFNKKILPTGAEVNVCNTTMCAAGTAVFLSHPPATFLSFVRHSRYNDWKEEGAKLLGLSLEEAGLVFMSDNKSAKRYMRAIAAGSQKKFDKATEKRKEF